MIKIKGSHSCNIVYWMHCNNDQNIAPSFLSLSFCTHVIDADKWMVEDNCMIIGNAKTMNPTPQSPPDSVDIEGTPLEPAKLLNQNVTSGNWAQSFFTVIICTNESQKCNIRLSGYANMNSLPPSAPTKTVQIALLLKVPLIVDHVNISIVLVLHISNNMSWGLHCNMINTIRHCSNLDSFAGQLYRASQ